MKSAKRIKGVMLACAALSSASVLWAQDWPQFRGPNRDSKIAGFTAPQTWPKELKQQWSAEVGLGESSPALVAGKLYVFGRMGNEEVTTCLDAANGKVVWQKKYKADVVVKPASRYPGPRSTPAVADGKVCTLGVGGVVTCLDAASGNQVWQKDTRAKPQFNTSTSPLIADGKCIVFLSKLTAFDLSTGDQRWEAKEGSTPYGSPVLMTVDGTRQIVTNAAGSIMGFSLGDGAALWKFPFPGPYQSTYMTPIIDGQTVIYSAPAGKGGGGSTVAFKVEKKGDDFAATELWNVKQAPYQYSTPVLHDSLIFGLSATKRFFCMDAKTGNTLWTDASAQRGEAGGILDAGKVILALTGDSELVAFEPSGKEYREVAKYKVSDTSGLAYPVIAGNRVYVKGKDSLTLWTME